MNINKRTSLAITENLAKCRIVGFVLLCLFVFNQNVKSSERLQFSKGNTPQISTQQAFDGMGFQRMLSNDDLRSVSFVKRGNLKIERYIQYHSGYPVIGGGVVVTSDLQDKLVSIYSSINSSLSFPLQSRKHFSASSAIDIALKYTKVSQLRGNISTETAYLPIGESAVLVWVVKIPSKEPLADIEVFVDAENGEVILLEDRLDRLDGTGWVFNPDPITTMQDTSLRDDDNSPDAVPEEAYFEVVLNFLEANEDGTYSLSGRYADTSPTENRIVMDEPEFFFDRSEDGFEEVMVYFHTSKMAEYLIEIGLEDIIPTPQQYEVNGVMEDVSFFSPFTGIITTGRGGVDDAEDAGVILHEYGHALMFSILGDWRGNETRMLSEGYCDYIAGDYAMRQDDNFLPLRLFKWDKQGNNWDGRVLDSELTYAELQDLDVYTACQMWSAFLMEIRLQINDLDDWNHLVYTSMAVLGDSAMAKDAVNALLLVDLNAFDGRFRRYIVDAADKRGIELESEVKPYLKHIPLKDTENLDDSRVIEVYVESQHSVSLDRSIVVFRVDDGDADTLYLEHDGGEMYSASIPPEELERRISYYIAVEDTLGIASYHPANAPLEWHSYHSGVDHIPPTIAYFDTIPHSVFPLGEINVTAIVEDNIGVESVELLWYKDLMIQGGTVRLERMDEISNRFGGKFYWRIGHQDGILYRFRAIDQSARNNVFTSNYFYFSIESHVLISDFEHHTNRWSLSNWSQSEIHRRGGDKALRGRGGLLDDNFQAIATLDEYWLIHQYRMVRLFFWERSDFDEDAGEYGVVEISQDSSRSWRQLMRFERSSNWWEQREVWLDDYAGFEAPPALIRFRVVTPENAEMRLGWFIDDIELRVEGRVDAPANNEMMPDEFLLNTYPNPVNSILRVNYYAPQPGSLLLYDAQGRLIEQLALQQRNGSLELDLSAYATGVYIVRLKSGNLSTTNKFLLLK